MRCASPATLVALTLFASLSSGCSHSIRDGVWELSLDIYFNGTNEAATPWIGPREVLVKVETASGGSGGEEDAMEEIEILPVDKEDGLKPLYGDILEAKTRNHHRVIIQHVDKDWVFQLIGYVYNPHEIRGERCYARARFEQLSLEGEWKMKWLRDA
jgi:hypothetical protein